MDDVPSPAPKLLQELREDAVSQTEAIRWQVQLGLAGLGFLAVVLLYMPSRPGVELDPRFMWSIAGVSGVLLFWWAYRGYRIIDTITDVLYGHYSDALVTGDIIRLLLERHPDLSMEYPGEYLLAKTGIDISDRNSIDNRLQRFIQTFQFVLPRLGIDAFPPFWKFIRLRIILIGSVGVASVLTAFAFINDPGRFGNLFVLLIYVLVICLAPVILVKRLATFQLQRALADAMLGGDNPDKPQ